MEILFLVLGIAIGLVLMWFFVKSRYVADLSVAKERAKLLELDLVTLKAEVTQKQEEILYLNRTLISVQSDYKNLDIKLKDQKDEMQKVQDKFNLEFKNLANEILEEKTKKFTEQNKSNLSEILEPFNIKIKEFEKKVEETYEKESQQRISLKEQVRQLAELNQQVSKEANSLTKALKGDSKIQGDWGEVILESILGHTGLRKDYEYSIQESFTLDNGRRLQPDVIVHYPGDRSVIIDSKVSLTAYEKFYSAINEEERTKAIKAHLLSVKNHINELSAKKYEELNGVKTLDFVMMFIPVEPAYLSAIQNEPDLWNYAYDKRILLISPTNLIAVLKMIESLWKQEFQNRNVLEIARQGGSLYDSFVLLTERLVNLGKRLDDADKYYQETMKTLSEGKGNLIGRVEKLKALGIKAKKQMPENLLSRAHDESDK